MSPEIKRRPASGEPVAQAGEALLGLAVVHPDGKRLGASHHDHQFAAAGYGRLNQVALQQDIMLGQNLKK